VLPRSYHRSRAFGPVLAALVLAVGLAACGISDVPSEATSPSTDVTTSTSEPTTTEPDEPDPGPDDPGGTLVTPDEAREAVDAFMEANNEANANLDTALLVDIETGAAAAIDEAWFRGQRNQNTKNTSTFTWDEVEVYVPRATEYPVSFLASVDFTADSGDNGVQIQVYEKASASAAWKLANYANMEPGTALPELAVDDEGYLTELDPADLAIDLEALPTELGKLMKDETADSRVESSDAIENIRFHFTDRFTDDVKPTVNHEIAYDIPAAPSYPTYAFPLTDGGALVLGVLGVRETITPVNGGAPIDVDPRITSGLVPDGAYTNVEMRSLLAFLGAVPGPDDPDGKADMMALLPGTIAATAS
jgi:hypothetical protein